MSAHGGARVNWFIRHRQDWIHESLHVFGFINREHVMRKFGVSRPQASKDLQRYQTDHSGAIAYNLTTKRYERASPGSMKQVAERG